MKIKSLAVIPFLIISFSAMAQGNFRPGYIVKNSGDSISGLVDYGDASINQKACFFKADKKSKRQEFSPNDLRAYGYIKDKRYESRLVKFKEGAHRMIFLETLVKGELSLFIHKGVFYVENDSLIELPKNNGKNIETDLEQDTGKDRSYVGILNSLILDCDLSATKTEYDQKELTNLIQNYNRCKGDAGLVYAENLPKVKLNYQVFTGFVASNLKVDDYDNDAFGTSQTVIGGVGIDLSSPRLFSKIFFSVESWYVNNIFQGYTETTRSGTTVRKDIIVNASFLKMPLGLRYNLLKESHTPYVKFGIVQYFELSCNLKTTEERELNSVVRTSIKEERLNGNNQRGFWIALGYSKQIYSRYKIFSELRYEKTNGFSDSTLQSGSSITSLQVLLGLRF